MIPYFHDYVDVATLLFDRLEIIHGCFRSLRGGAFALVCQSTKTRIVRRLFSYRGLAFNRTGDH